MTLYHYFKKDNCILPRECDIGDSSLSGKEVSKLWNYVPNIFRGMWPMIVLERITATA